MSSYCAASVVYYEYDSYEVSTFCHQIIFDATRDIVERESGRRIGVLLVGHGGTLPIVLQHIEEESGEGREEVLRRIEAGGVDGMANTAITRATVTVTAEGRFEEGRVDEDYLYREDHLPPHLQ